MELLLASEVDFDPLGLLLDGLLEVRLDLVEALLQLRERVLLQGDLVVVLV